MEKYRSKLPVDGWLGCSAITCLSCSTCSGLQSPWSSSFFNLGRWLTPERASMVAKDQTIISSLGATPASKLMLVTSLPSMTRDLRCGNSSTLKLSSPWVYDLYRSLRQRRTLRLPRMRTASSPRLSRSFGGEANAAAASASGVLSLLAGWLILIDKERRHLCNFSI